MLKQFVLTLALVSFLGTFTLAQEKPDTEKKKDSEQMQEMHKSSDEHSMKKEMKMNENHTIADEMSWNKLCPVKGGEVDPEVATVEYNGKHYGFCCPGCDLKFKDDPDFRVLEKKVQRIFTDVMISLMTDQVLLDILPENERIQWQQTVEMMKKELKKTEVEPE